MSNLVNLGPIGLDHSRRTSQMLLACLIRGETVVVDMSGINYIDSASIVSLVEAHYAARKSGKDFSLLHVSAAVMRILRLARLERVFTIIDRTPNARVNRRKARPLFRSQTNDGVRPWTSDGSEHISATR